MSESHLQQDQTDSSEGGLSKITVLKTVKLFTYFGFLAVLIILLISQAAHSIIVYLEGPTYTETLLHNQEKTTFPEITICPLENGYKEDVLKVIIKICLIFISHIYIITKLPPPLSIYFSTYLLPLFSSLDDILI